MTKVVTAARSQFEAMTGRHIETVSGVSRDGDVWRVAFEVVELQRIPESTSLLGSYEVIVNDDGTLAEYGRVRRYYRNRADEEL